MPLGSKTAQTTELWGPIINKETGKPYTGLEKCASLERLDKEEKQLSDLLDEKLNAWIDQDPQKREEELRDFKKGFKYQHTDGYTYKIVQNNQGEHQLSRSKGFGAGGGGYRRTGTTYIHLRTVIAKVCRVEEIAPIINDQQDNDNWEIIQLQADTKGDRFLLLNKKPYTPTLGETASGSKEATTKEAETEAETETESTE